MTDRYYDTEEGLEAWESFWTQFEDASLEERFTLAEDRIEDDPHVDGEFAFELARRLWSSLGDTAEDYRRYCAWLDALRDQRPEAADAQRGLLLYYDVWATCLLDEPIEEETLDALFDAFLDHPDACDAAFDLLMYHGRGDGLADAMPEVWMEIRDHTDRIGGLSAFAWLGLMLNLARAVARDSDATFEGDLVEHVAPVVDAEQRGDVERLLDHLAGRAAVDADRLQTGALETRIDATVRLVAEYWGELIREDGWAWSKATLAFDMFDQFYRRHLEAEAHGAPDTVPPGTASAFDERIDEALPVAFHPGDVAAFLEQFAGRDLFPGHQRAALVEALPGWLAFLVERDLLADELADELIDRLREPLDDATAPLFDRGEDDIMLEKLQGALECFGEPE